MHIKTPGVVKALNAIESNLMEEIDTRSLHKYSNSSYYHFSKIFKKEVGAPINAYVRARKMEIAARQLVWTDHNVTRIANRLGYNNSAFSRAFSNVFGISPLAFRKVLIDKSGRPDVTVKSIRIIYRKTKNYIGRSYSVDDRNKKDIWSDFMDATKAFEQREISEAIGLLHTPIISNGFGRLRYECLLDIDAFSSRSIADEIDNMGLNSVTVAGGSYAYVDYDGDYIGAKNTSRLLSGVNLFKRRGFSISDRPFVEMNTSLVSGKFWENFDSSQKRCLIPIST